MTDLYAYLNLNPFGDEEEDCVTRAISLGLRIDYDAVRRLLDVIADLYGCERLHVGCYAHLLQDVFGLEVRDGAGYTVGELARAYPNNILLIRIDGHLTCSYFGTIYDIWDCTHEEIDRYWIAK